MNAMASQSTSVTIVYSTVYSDVDQRNHQSSASLAFVGGINRWPVDSPHKRPVTRKIFPFDDAIMENKYSDKIFQHACDTYPGMLIFLFKSWYSTEHYVIHIPWYLTFHCLTEWQDIILAILVIFARTFCIMLDTPKWQKLVMDIRQALICTKHVSTFTGMSPMRNHIPALNLEYRMLIVSTENIIGLVQERHNPIANIAYIDHMS